MSNEDLLILEKLRKAPSGSFWDINSWLGVQVRYKGKVGKVVEDRKVRRLLIDFGAGEKKEIELPLEGKDHDYLKSYEFKVSKELGWFCFYRDQNSRRRVPCNQLNVG